MVFKRWTRSVGTVAETSFTILSLIAVIFVSGILVYTEGAAGLVTDSSQNLRESVIPGDSDEGVESVTFVTEDEHYDDETSGGEGSRSDSWIHHERERRREEERCPPLPEPSAANVKFCEARKCLTDQDCRSNSTDQATAAAVRSSETSQEFICCFNGCIHSCLPRVNPPSVFDWLEETDVNKFLEPPSNNSSEETLLQTKSLLMSAKQAPEEIALPGGCLIKMKQYEDLLLFRKNKHVSSCSCSGGDVVCQVNNGIISSVSE